MADAEPQSALVIFVPEAEPLVGRYRSRSDPSALEGCPAHITLLYPFKPPGEIGDAELAALADSFAGFAPVTYSLVAPRRFPGVLYLAPDPKKAFIEMTLGLVARFPETPPYGGRHREIVPHLTVAQIADEGRLNDVSKAFAEAAEEALPIAACAKDVELIDSCSGRWEVRRTFKLGGARRAAQPS